MLAEASQVRESDYEESRAPEKNLESPEDKKDDDDNLEIDTDSGEFHSIPNTPLMERHTPVIEGEWRVFIY